MASGTGTEAVRNRIDENSLAILLLVITGQLSQTTGVSAQTGDWPDHDAYWIIEIKKDPDSSPPPHEPGDLHWFRLHRNHPTLPDALSNTIAPGINHGYELLNPVNSNIQARYTVHGVVVSDWIDPPFRFDLSVDNPALGARG